jgi:DNA-directed RNA polymerase subunit RPC12/RpoP
MIGDPPPVLPQLKEALEEREVVGKFKVELRGTDVAIRSSKCTFRLLFKVRPRSLLRPALC